MSRLKKKKTGKSPVFVILLLIALTLLITFVLSLLGFGGNKTYIANGGLETTLVTVRNPLSIKGLSSIFSSGLDSFMNFKPLVYLLIALLGIGVLDKSGLLDELVKPFKKFRINIIIFLTFIISILFTYFGEYSYSILLPITALLYKKMGRNPILGIMVCFIGITVGYGTNFIFNYDDYYLGKLTQASASLEVDKNYKFILNSSLIIMISSSVIISIIGTLLVKKNLEPNVYAAAKSEEDEITYSKKGFVYSLLAFIFMILVLVYFLLPIKLPYAGSLLGSDKEYISRLFSETSPFRSGFLIIFVVICSICGLIYGFVSKKFKDSHDFGASLSSNYGFIGEVVLYSFLISQLLSIISWTRLGEVISYTLIEFMNSLQFSGIPLIIMFFVIVVITSIFVPGLYDKWAIMSPTIVPLFMRSNITPDFTQFIFKAGDGVGKCISPMFGYFVIMLALINFYKKENNITFFGTYRKILPTYLALLGVWILILIGWFVIGLPLGIGTFTTL